MRQNRSYSPEDWMRAILRMVWRTALYAFLIVAAIYIASRLKTVIIYLIIGVILAYIMRPIASFLIAPATKRPRNAVARAIQAIRIALGKSVPRSAFGRPMSHHGRRALATFYVLVLLFVGGYFAARFMLRPFGEQISNVVKNWDTVYKPRFEMYTSNARDWYTTHVKQEWRDKIEQSLKQSGDSDGLQKQVSAVAGEAAKHLAEFAHNIVEIVLLPVLAFYFALDSKKLKHEFVAVFPVRHRREVCRVIHEFNLIMHSFVVGQVILCMLAGVFIGVLLALLGVPYALTLGLLAGFTRAIPIIGPILGGIPIILLTLVTAGLPTALVILTVFTILHFAESKFIMPMIIGERMNLHPVVIIIVLLIGQEFGGLLGMFFAAPIAALMRVMVGRYWMRRNVPRPAVASLE